MAPLFKAGDRIRIKPTHLVNNNWRDCTVLVTDEKLRTISFKPDDFAGGSFTFELRTDGRYYASETTYPSWQKHARLWDVERHGTAAA